MTLEMNYRFAGLPQKYPLLLTPFNLRTTRGKPPPSVCVANPSSVSYQSRGGGGTSSQADHIQSQRCFIINLYYFLSDSPDIGDLLGEIINSVQMAVNLNAIQEEEDWARTFTLFGK